MWRPGPHWVDPWTWIHLKFLGVHFKLLLSLLPFILHEKYDFGTSRFTENKRERFGKSQLTATMEITIHKEKNSHFTFYGK